MRNIMQGRFNAILQWCSYWALNFVRAIQDWELESLMTFMDTIYGLGIRVTGENKMFRKPDKKKGFKVGTYYHLLDAAAFTKEQPFPWKIIWSSKALPRVTFFGWTAALGKILIIDHLRKTKIRITDFCCMCKCNGESVDHIFLHFPIASDLWSMILDLFGVSWVITKSVVQILAYWQGHFGHLWTIIPHCLI